MVLGDNIYYVSGLRNMLQRAANKEEGATVFGYHVNDPERFGVVEFDENGKVLSVEEKPEEPSPNNASKRGVSSGVEIIKISRIPANINVDNG
ncbi:sugar phosphate nucleotidyltransferase [Escherichia sp. R-CC3]